jgi:hypothetical protein
MTDRQNSWLIELIDYDRISTYSGKVSQSPERCPVRSANATPPGNGTSVCCLTWFYS